MFKARSLIARIGSRSALALVIALACAVPVFAANIGAQSNDNGGTAATTVVVNKPTDLAVGDVMVASVSYWGPTTTSVTSPGWTQIAKRTHTQPNPDLTLVSFWKEADAADVAASNFTFTLSVAAQAFAGVARYDDVVTTGGSPVVASATNPLADDNPGQSTSLVANSVTTTQPGQYVTAIYALTDATGISSGPLGMTELYNRVRSTGTNPGRLAAYDVSQAAAVASGTKTATAAGNVRYIAQTIALKTEPTKLGFSTTPITGAVDTCLGPIKVQTQNTAGGATNPLADTEVGLATDGTGSFFSDSGCATGLTQGDRTIGSGANEFTFFYKPTATGAHTLTATATGLTQAQQVETVKLAQTITFAQPPSPQKYGDTFDIGSATSDSGLTVTVTPSGGCTLNGTTATVTSATTDCTLTATQDGDSTYLPAQAVARTVVTDPRPITVTADSGQSKVYNNGNSNPTYTYSVTLGNLVGTDTFTGALARAAGENVDTSPYAINQGNLSAGNNYAITFEDDTFAITARPLSMNGNNASKTYGDADPAFSATLTNFAPGHNNRNQAGVTGTESCTRSNPLVENVATYDDVISCTQGTLTAANGNYSFTPGTSGDFTINPKQLTVDADPGTKTYGDADPAFTATLNGFAFSETPATANVTGAATCSRAGADTDVNTYPGVLSCLPGTLAAPNYTFAAGTANDFTITQRTAHVTSTVANKVYNRSAAAQILTSVLTNRAPGETATEVDFTGGSFSAVFNDASVGQNKPVDITASPAPTLTGTKAANYTLVVDDATASITPVHLTGAFTAASKVYNKTTAASVATSSLTGVLSGDTVNLTGTANFASNTVGNGKTVTLSPASLTGAQAGNYTLDSVSTTTANITPKSVTGSFTAADKDFDGTNAATITGRSVSGAIVGDAVTLTGGTATFSDANPGVNKTVTGTGFALGGAAAGNYTLGSVGTTTADIRQRDPEEAPPGQQKSPAEKAADLLGGDVKVLDLGLGSVGFAFAPKSQGKAIKPINQKLFAIGGCSVPCTVAAAKTIVLTTGGASAAATKKIKLKTQKLSLAANQLGVVKLKLTKKQKRKIKKADKAKLIVKVTLTAGAQKATGKKTYKFKKP